MEINNPREKKPKKVEKLTKYGKKLKMMMMKFPASAGKRSTDDKSSSSSSSSSSLVPLPPPPPAAAVHCDELFHASERKRGHSTMDINDVNNASSVVVAHIAAQNHFSLRPNIYI